MKNLIELVDGYYWPINSLSTLQANKKTLNMDTVLLPLCIKKNVMVQAGGNCGLTVKPFASAFKHVYTFEPDPVNFLCLTLNIDSPNVYKFQCCLGDEHKTIKLDNYSATDSGAYFVGGDGIVPTLLIDDLNLTECDLIMLDVEGYELHALNGAIETIKKYGPVICIEHAACWLERYNTSITEIENLLIDKLGYIYATSFSTGYSTDKIYVKTTDK
jgi:FkbM family methyltransferase